MKRALIVSYYWPPTGGSGVQRWVKFCKYLPAAGWQCTVCTPDNPDRLASDSSLLDDIPAETEVLRLPIREPYALYRRLTGRSGAVKGAGVNPVNAQKKSFLQRLILFLRSNLFVPDPRAGWVRPATRYLKAWLQEHPADVLVTTGPPHSMHLIGLRLHRATGIPWVADFRDPWTRIFYFKHLSLLPAVRKRHFRLEQAVLDEASAVVSVSPRVQADFAARTRTTVHLITNGYDEEDFDRPAPEPDGFFRLVHTGLFASDGNPGVFWDVLAHKCAQDPEFHSRLRLVLAGKVDPEIVASLRKRGLMACVELPGYLPHNESVEALLRADLLLLPLRWEPEYSKVLPGKIFEYLAARRPVLGIGPVNSAAADVLRDAGAGVFADWIDALTMSQTLDAAWDDFRSGTARRPEGRIEVYARRLLTQRMADLFNSLL